jgi:truncated hemoglobin YjbI
VSALHQIETTVREVVRRRRWLAAWRGFWLGLLIGSSLGLLTLILYKVLPVPTNILAVAGGIALAAAPVGFVAGWFGKKDAMETARWLDREKGLHERLSTALEVSQRKPDDWQKLVVDDAARHLQGISPRQMLPLRLSRAAQWSLLALALAAGLGFVPEYRTPAYWQAQRDKQNIQQVAQQLAGLTKQNLKDNPPTLEPTQKAMDAVVDLANLMAMNPPSRGDALKEVGKLEDEIKKQYSELTQKAAIKKLDKAAREQAAAGGAKPGELQKQIQDLQDKLGEASGQAEKLEKLKQDLEKAKESGKSLADNKNQPGEDEARQKLAEALAGINQQAQGMGQPLQGLEAAIKALEEGNTDLFLKDLDLAVKDMDKLKELAKTLEKMQQQMGDKTGKDLAEQLEFGQAEMAIGTLEKMMEQLKNGNLTPEQAQRIMEEVRKALQPAGKYGEVEKKLAQAIQNLQQGRKGEAAQQLGDAAKELEDLLKQFGDAQAMAATLSALEQAQMAIATCQGGQSFGRGRPAFGKGGKPGRGVGTWAEEEGWLYYPERRDSLWDNTGIEMPEMDPRGQSERDVQKPENRDPTKVRGQFAPGAPLPSITLKGVSIKGVSNVKFEEAAAAAQAKAQNALNQDQVPRAYRNSVKDYFDDFK